MFPYDRGLGQACPGRRQQGTRFTSAYNALIAFIVGLVLLSAVFLMPGRSRSSETDDHLWSLRFDNVTVAEALNALTRATGVTLYGNRSPGDKRVNRVYENETIEQIVRDVFRGENYTLIWHYGKQGLESIGIWFVQDGGDSRKGYEREASRRLGWNAERRSADEVPTGVNEMEEEEPSPRRPLARQVRPSFQRSSDRDDEETLEEEDVTETATVEAAEPDNSKGLHEEEEVVEDEAGSEDESTEETVREETDGSAEAEGEPRDTEP